MVLWEAIIVMHPQVPKDQLLGVMKMYCTHVLRDGGVVRKFSNEGVMRMQRGMHAGPTDKRRLYVPRMHKWRVHEPVDEKLFFHGRYLVMLYDSSVQTCLAFQDLVNNNQTTLEWQIRNRNKHHPMAAFKDPHDFEIGHDMQTLSEEQTQLNISHPQWKQWKTFQARRWSEYLAQNPNTTDVTLA
eukprot:TRINITY_DN21401_c0_g1_i1.p2 TRINITY_DN21401_c0_g1~~TRINITY_DN21401_c0_g1_i1.p2  ORF type:complete len:185 (+),score=58.86 TRINITY_DN21401_c0_g1_i1:43-597(+)